jgi:hypothetical protein
MALLRLRQVANLPLVHPNVIQPRLDQDAAGVVEVPLQNLYRIDRDRGLVLVIVNMKMWWIMFPGSVIHTNDYSIVT